MIRYKVVPEDQIKVEAEYHSKHRDATNTEGKEKLRLKHIKYLQRMFKKITSVLCVGARDDSEINTFISKGYKVLGVDVALNTNLIKKMDAHKLKEHFVAKQFDVVYASHSLEHMYDTDLVLEGIRHVAKKGMFAVLPLPWREDPDLMATKPSINHPSIFDIMRLDLPTKEDVTWEVLLDFHKLEPFKLCHYNRRYVSGRPYEVELGFRFY